MRIYKSNYESSRTLARHCLNCGSIFWARPCDLKFGRGNFCSPKCSALSRNTYKTEEHKRKISETLIEKKIVAGENNPNWRGGDKVLICSECGQEFSFKRSTEREFCSRECAAKSRGRMQSGENHPGWKGGIGSLKHEHKRMHTKAKEWREKVFDRDEYKCTICEKSKPRIHSHHIFSWAKFPELRYDVDNGMTLCLKHHQMFHPGIVLCDTRKYLQKADCWEN